MTQEARFVAWLGVDGASPQRIRGFTQIASYAVRNVAMPTKPSVAHEPSAELASSASLVVRTRTNPTLKWLANEIAAKRGAIASAEATIAAYTAELSKLQNDLVSLEQTAGQLKHLGNRPDLGTIRAHGRYGAKGQLLQFILDQVMEASPRGLSVAQLFLAIKTEFELPLVLSAEVRRYCKNSLRPALQQLEAKDLVERFVLETGSTHLRWRYKNPSPTFDVVARQAQGESSGGH